MKSRTKWSLRKRGQIRSNTSLELAPVDALAVQGILNAEQLERAFERERARVERNQQCFSLAVFRLPGAKTLGSMREAVENTAAVLLKRVRTYDDVGLVDEGSLAVMLPETSGSDTWIFADGALADLREHGLTANCEVYTYPHPDHGVSHESDHREVQKTQSVLHSTAGPVDDRGHVFGDYSRVEHPKPLDHPGEAPSMEIQGSLHAISDRNAGPLLWVQGEGESNATEFQQEFMGRAAFGISSGSSALAPVPAPSPDDQSTARTLSWPAPATIPPEKTRTETRPVRDLAPYFEESLPAYRRLVDIVVAASALAFVSPILITAAALVKLSSPGPVIFAQARAGRGGRPFQFYKLRSMYRDAEDRKNALRLVNEKDGPIFKIKNDPRITPVGKVLRKFSIDELPQLFNVLRGDMTLVGPRPPVMAEIDEYETWQRQRLDITGGITCIWQVSGRSDVTFREWMRMDVRYRKKRSLTLDLKLVWKTFGAVFSGKGAY